MEQQESLAKHQKHDVADASAATGPSTKNVNTMNSRPPIVTLTENAANRIREILLAKGEPESGLRIGVARGGCAGMEYAVDLVVEPSQGDEIVRQHGVWVCIASSALMYMIGSEIDYRSSPLESGFKFNNPNVTETCGCGISVKIDPNRSV